MRNVIGNAAVFATVDGSAAAGNGASESDKAAGESDKVARSAEHYFLAKDGSIGDGEGEGFRAHGIEAAVGCRYLDKATGESVDYTIPGAKAGTRQTMLAVFGLRTKMVNEASAARQLRKRDASETISDVGAIREWLAEDSFRDGQWTAEVSREGGPRFNPDILAAAIARAKGEADASPYAAKIAADPAYGPGAMKVPQVKALYGVIRGERALAAAKSGEGVAGL